MQRLLHHFHLPGFTPSSPSLLSFSRSIHYRLCIETNSRNAMHAGNKLKRLVAENIARPKRRFTKPSKVRVAEKERAVHRIETRAFNTIMRELMRKRNATM